MELCAKSVRCPSERRAIGSGVLTSQWIRATKDISYSVQLVHPADIIDRSGQLAHKRNKRREIVAQGAPERSAAASRLVVNTVANLRRKHVSRMK